MKIFIRDKIINTLFKIILPFYGLIIALFAFLFFLKGSFWLGLGMIYLVPVCTWRLINFFFPLEEGKSYIAGATFSPWLSSYRIQEIYIKIPLLERLILLVPFLFNLWLRAWGAKIGKRVLFAPNTTIVDRPGIEIGDYVYLGDQCYFSSHLILEKNKKFICIYKKIKIEEDCFIGAFTKFAPGAKVKKGSRVRTFSFFRINSDVAESFVAPEQEKVIHAHRL